MNVTKSNKSSLELQPVLFKQGKKTPYFMCTTKQSKVAPSPAVNTQKVSSDIVLLFFVVEIVG